MSFWEFHCCVAGFYRHTHGQEAEPDLDWAHELIGDKDSW